MEEPAHRCRVCRVPVNGPEDGVAFGVNGRFLFVTCLAHAPMVRAGVKTGMKAVVAGINAVIDRKIPVLGKVLREVRAVRDKELEA